MAKTKIDRVRIVTPTGRIVFPYLSEPDEGRQYSDGKYKVDILFSKDTWKEQGKELREAVLEVAKQYYGKKTIKFSDFKHPFKDGDTKQQDYYKNCYYITPKSQFEPAVVGADKTAFAKDRIRQIKGGDYARLVVTIYPYDQSGGGVTLGLEILQFAHEGEALSGGRAAAMSMIDELDVELSDLDVVESEDNTVEEEDDVTI
jgi:hypothetical protein